MPGAKTLPLTLGKDRVKSGIPQAGKLDSTVALLREGYNFVSNRCQRLKTDVFQTRLMLRKVICMQGAEAGQIFYGGAKFTRKGAIPVSTVRLLQDFGSVQNLDDQAHLVRKRMFMSLMSKPSVEQLVKLAEEEWQQRILKWEEMEAVILHKEVQEIFCRAVCKWAGLELSDREFKKRTKEFASMIDGAGNGALRNLRGQSLRTRSERWAQTEIEKARYGVTKPPEGSALHTIAWHRNENGQLLKTKIAAVELLNVLRPTVAVARFVVFAAVALYEHPETREKLHDEEQLEFFVQEVRRFYPFFPFVGGRVKEEFDWRGHHFKKREWVLFDLYGTNHDPRIWQDPEVFRPERFRDWDGSAFNFVPQGGGDFLKSHRCPGESITIELMKMSVRMLAFGVKYSVPEQNLEIRFSRMPAIPESGFIIRNVNYGI